MGLSLLTPVAEPLRALLVVMAVEEAEFQRMGAEEEQKVQQQMEETQEAEVFQRHFPMSLSRQKQWTTSASGSVSEVYWVALWEPLVTDPQGIEGPGPAKEVAQTARRAVDLMGEEELKLAEEGVETLQFEGHSFELEGREQQGPELSSEDA